MSEDREDRGFKVEDRRRFEADGEERAGVPETETEARGAGPAARPASTTLSELDFSTFVLSLTTSAMMHLGDAPHPDGATRKDLALAKQTIDILGMLREKTQGNLAAEEARLLDEVLYDLRLRYVGMTTH